MQKPNHNLIEEMLTRMDDFRIIKRVPLTISDTGRNLSSNTEFDPGRHSRLIILDVESTGLDKTKHSVIELGMVEVYVDRVTGHIARIGRIYNELEDPGYQIDETITEITGLTNEELKGRRIDDETVAEMLSGDPIVVAHNASFDCGFIEKRFPSLPALRWVCTANDLDWIESGIKSRKLELMLLESGYFYDAHRATVDCLAVTWLLNLNPLQALKILFIAEERVDCVIRAFNSPYHTKDLLKKNGYKWDDGSGQHAKHWWKATNGDLLEDETQFLASLYDFHSEGMIERVDARSRHGAATA